MSMLRHGGLPPPHPKVREALEQIDRDLRARGSCTHCGQSIHGVQFLDYATGRVQSRAEAGLCECEPMRQVCAWCDAVIQDGRADWLSHGICAQCRAREFPETAA